MILYNCMIFRLTLYTQDLAVRIMRISQNHYPARNCCRHVADVAKMLHLWGRGGMVDTLVLGTSLVRGGSSSLLDPTKSEKKHLSIITKLFISDLGIWLGLMWTKPLGSNRYTFLQGI